jgi:GH24 family phage-related lysozyme (muramidase)
MKYSATGFAFLKGHEGLILFVYDDLVYPTKPHTAGTPVLGTLTAGYGHTGPDVYSGMEVTDTMADIWLLNDISWAENKVNQKIKKPGLNQAQFDMLVSHTFNTGGSETLYSLVNDWLAGNGTLEAVGWWWTQKYITSKGKTLPGLIKRRAEEWEIFEGGYNMYEVKKNCPS